VKLKGSVAWNAAEKKKWALHQREAVLLAGVILEKRARHEGKKGKEKEGKAGQLYRKVKD